MENYLDRSQPIFPTEQLELQAHGTRVAYRDIYVRRLTGGAEKFTLSEEEKSAGFEVLFDGTHLDKWTGNKDGYVVEDGNIVIYPERGNGNLFTSEEYGDFNFRFERSEEHTSELQSLMRISYAVFCLKKKIQIC